MNNYKPSLTHRWPDEYFDDRNQNNEKRLKQFQIDKEFIAKFISSGKICDMVVQLRVFKIS